MSKTIFACLFDKDKFLSLGKCFSSTEGFSLLFSGGDFDSSRYSYMFIMPKKAFSIVSEKKSYRRKFFFEKVIHTDNIDPWALLKNEFQNFSNDGENVPIACGYIGYEFGKDFHQKEKKDIPLSFFLFYTFILKFDHINGILRVFFIDSELDHLPIEEKTIIEKLSKGSSWENFLKNSPDEWNDLLNEHFGINKKKGIFKGTSPLGPLLSFFKENKTLPPFFCAKESYLDKIKKIKTLIEEGEVYEVNLSHELVIDRPNKSDPFFIFLKLNEINPSPFSAYLNLKDFVVVSSSPERFLLKKKNYLETRPIKGTINRGESKREDELNLHYLRSSEKERSELRMITDLLRNDLYPVSKTNSIEAKELFRVEKYSNVFHMLSIVCGEAKEGVHPVDIIKSCFPSGSVTGCPKLASQKVIASFEERERGIYTGSIGYFTNKGDFDFNIAIRTLLFKKDRIFMPVGGAILIDSDPEKEYFETYFKAKSMLEALNMKVTL